MDLLFIALGILLVWYVVDSYVHHGHSSEYKEFAKEQARNKARKARLKEKSQSATEATETAPTADAAASAPTSDAAPSDAAQP